MIFEQVRDLLELFPDFRHILAERIFDLLGEADAGDDVFALSVDEVVARDPFDAGGAVTRQRDAGGAVVAHIAEYHRLNVDGGAPVVRDAVHPAIDDRAVVHPAAEDGADRAPHLFARIFREIFSRRGFDGGFEFGNEFFQGRRGEFRVKLNAAGGLFRVEDLFEGVDFSLVGRFHFEDDVAVHLDETAVAVPGETFVARFFGEDGDGLVVQTDVQNGIHHTRHRFAGARTAGDQKGKIFGIAELLAHRLFDGGQRGFDLIFEFRRILTAVVVEVGADFGRDREPGRNGKTDLRHFSEVRAFAAKEITHRSVAVGSERSKTVNVLCHNKETLILVWWTAVRDALQGTLRAGLIS